MLIQFGGLTIMGQYRRDSSGLVMKPEGFQGWRGLPEGRRESLARAVQHGEFDVPVFLPARVVTIDAWIIADSEEQLEHLCDRVAGAASTDLTRFTVTARGSTKTAEGRRTSCEVMDPDGGARETDFQMQIVFPDPRKYGAVNATPLGTAHEVFHRGNFPAYSVVEIPSAPSSYSINTIAGTFTVSGATAGGTHRVDLRSGRVTRNGVELPGVGHGDLWTTPPGTPTTFVLSVAGTVLTPDTFI